MKQYRYLHLITLLYVTVQLASDVSASKLVDVFGVPLSISIFYFPLTFIFADILTEVYGYAVARRVIWEVMLCTILAGVLYQFIVWYPPSVVFVKNDAYAAVLGALPRVLFGGWIARWAGAFANDYVLARMKVWTAGKFLWMRTITSTIVGEGLNTILFYTIALFGVLPVESLAIAILMGTIMKTLVEVLFTPVMYYVVMRLKRAESEDYFDRHTNFNPFVLKV